MPPATVTVSIAKKKTFNNDKLKRLATVSSKALQIGAIMVKSYRRKICEHDISYASVKSYKATMGSLSNPKLASQRDPPDYTL